jgi:predicted XRE-type DNA-binding protein
MGIPEARERLLKLAAMLDAEGLTEYADEIDNIVSQMWRKPPATKSKVKSQSKSPALGMAIRAYVAAHPDKSQQEVAHIFDVNHGRVSEAINKEF